MSTVAVRVTVRDRSGASAVRDVTVVEQPRVLLGMDANPADWAATLAAFGAGNIRYTRDFGKKIGGAVLPSLSAHGTGKAVGASANCVIHYGWKTDVEQLSSWLDGLTRRSYLSWHHEPMSDMTPAAYRATAGRITQILAGHPKRHLVLGHGPVTTRYWLDEGKGDPDDWAYPGMTHYGVDCYNGWTDRYRTPAQMFGVAFGKLRTRYPGIRLWVPEYGVERNPNDPTGSGRVAAIDAQVRYLLVQPDVDGVGWWNIGDDFIIGMEPEQAYWRQTLAAQP